MGLLISFALVLLVKAFAFDARAVASISALEPTPPVRVWTPDGSNPFVAKKEEEDVSPPPAKKKEDEKKEHSCVEPCILRGSRLGLYSRYLDDSLRDVPLTKKERDKIDDAITYSLPTHDSLLTSLVSFMSLLPFSVSLDGGSLLGAVRDGARKSLWPCGCSCLLLASSLACVNLLLTPPFCSSSFSPRLVASTNNRTATMWDDDFDIVAEQDAMPLFKGMCEQKVSDAERQAFWDKETKRFTKKKDNWGPRCTVSSPADGRIFSFFLNKMGFVFVCELKSKNETGCARRVTDLFWAGLSDAWAKPPQESKFPLVKRQFGQYEMFTYNDPVPYLSLLYGKNFTNEYRVMNHQVSPS